jgi:hypothetical protein
MRVGFGFGRQGVGRQGLPRPPAGLGAPRFDRSDTGGGLVIVLMALMTCVLLIIACCYLI